MPVLSEQLHSECVPDSEQLLRNEVPPVEQNRRRIDINNVSAAGDRHRCQIEIGELGYAIAVGRLGSSIETEVYAMAATGLDVFDKTLQTTNIWLNEITDDLGPDRKLAYRALRAVLHAFRDRLTIDEAAHFGAQLRFSCAVSFTMRGIRPGSRTTSDRKKSSSTAWLRS